MKFLYLPVTFLGNWNVGMLSLEVFWINPSKNKLATLFRFRISVEPEWEDLVVYKILLNHIVPALFSWIILSEVLEERTADMMNLSSCFQEAWSH